MSETQTRMNPLIAIAAIAVIIFSAVGVGVMTGVIPSSFSKNEQQAAALPDSAAQAKTAAAEPAPVPAPAPKKTASHPVHKAPAHTASTRPAQVAAAEPPRPTPCTSCGTVETINAIEQPGQGSGLGAIAGGVVGGILGNQVGSGRGRTVATVVGAGAGAFAGNEVEKRVKKTQHYDVVVHMEDGSTRTFPYDTQPSFRPGDKVKVVEGALVAN